MIESETSTITKIKINSILIILLFINTLNKKNIPEQINQD